ncbi:MAG: FkbM family methyltransferase [Thermoleophilaceae bacterium]
MTEPRDRRQTVKRAAWRLGLERPLRAAYEWRNPAARRDRTDNETLLRLLAFSLREDSNCIDVGCHRGEVLAEMLRLAPGGHHIAFEPVPASHASLAADFPAADVRKAAVSDTDGEADFVVVPGLPSFSGLRERSYPGEQRTERVRVETCRLDGCLPAGYVPRLVKVDVEGAELHVLRGARETLRRHRPIVWFEHGAGGADHYGTSPADVHRLLAGEIGMRIFDADGRGPYSERDFVAVFDEPIWSFVAH